MNRIRPLSVLAVLVALSFVLVACGGGESAKSDESPQAVINEATLQEIESGVMDLSVSVNSPGAEGGNVDVSLSGQFQSKGRGHLPQLNMIAKASGDYKGKKVDFDGGLMLLSNRAYVAYEGTEYEVDPTTFSFIEETLKQAQREGGAQTGSAGATACLKEFGELEVAKFLQDAKSEGSADVDGTTTTKVSGKLNVPGAIGSLLEAVKGPACRSQLAAAGPLPSKDEIESGKDELKSSVKGASVEVYVGDDNIVRGISTRLMIEPHKGGTGPRSAEIAVDLELTDVNEEQEISAPENAKPLSGLFTKLGIDPIELLGVLRGEESGRGLGELFENLATAGGQ